MSSFRNLSSKTTNEFSSIEHLILDNGIDLNDLCNLLSYIPNLRYFSTCLFGEHDSAPIKLPYLILNRLTHVSFTRNCGITFDDLEPIFINYFGSIQVLDLTVDSKCMNANRWKQSISSYLPKLRVFDILFESILD
ncbi:hypothetical protein I4U23_016653 [Adineta vaga]|nr:hypothetical protein I4U23_016653 [Adineta vaga]